MNITELINELSGTDELNQNRKFDSQQINKFLETLESAQKNQMLSDELKRSIRFAQSFIYQFARLKDEDKKLIIEIMRRNQWDL